MEEFWVLWNYEKIRMIMRDIHRKKRRILMRVWTVGNIWLFKVFYCYFIQILPMLLLISGSVFYIIIVFTSGSPSNSPNLLTGIKVLPYILMTQTSLWELGCGTFLSPKITFFLQLFSDFFSCLEFIEINNSII